MLLNQRKVLFIGTPCDIGNLISFLKKNKCQDFDKLVTLDFICQASNKDAYILQKNPPKYYYTYVLKIGYTLFALMLFLSKLFYREELYLESGIQMIFFVQNMLKSIT